jgi:hypothetical protein
MNVLLTAFLFLPLTSAFAQVPTFTENLNKGSFQLMPNPATQVVHLIPDSTVDHMHVLIYDEAGRNVLSTELRGPLTLDVSSLPDGAYMVSTSNDRGTALDAHRLIIAR